MRSFSGVSCAGRESRLSFHPELMAIAIIFGHVFATMLTLGVVPVLYSLLFRVRFRDFPVRTG